MFFYNSGKLKDQNKSSDYVADEMQLTLFDFLEIEKPAYKVNVQKGNWNSYGKSSSQKVLECLKNKAKKRRKWVVPKPGTTENEVADSLFAKVLRGIRGVSGSLKFEPTRLTYTHSISTLEPEFLNML